MGHFAFVRVLATVHFYRVFNDVSFQIRPGTNRSSEVGTTDISGDSLATVKPGFCLNNQLIGLWPGASWGGFPHSDNPVSQALAATQMNSVHGGPDQTSESSCDRGAYDLNSDTGMPKDRDRNKNGATDECDPGVATPRNEICRKGVGAVNDHKR